MMISEATYWWNHLTYQQRVFIRDYQNKQKLSSFDVNVTSAYEMKEQFHTMAGWPEDTFK